MRRTLVCLVLATSSLASAESKATAPSFANAAATELVEAQLIRPLVAKEESRSKFSRARVPASVRRVRVLDRAPVVDASGNAFVRFAVDEKYGWAAEDEDSKWSQNQITGCAYVEAKEVFIDRGGKIHPAAARLGKKTKPAAKGVCEPSTQLAAQDR